MMKAIKTSIIVLLLFKADVFASVNVDIEKVESKVTNVDKRLYGGTKISHDNGEYRIDLDLRNPRDGYDFDTIRLCWAKSNCSGAEWALFEKGDEEYFNSAVYAGIRSYRLDSLMLTSAFSLCQVSNKYGETSMAGQCYTMIVENEGNKYIYTTYLGGAVKCRPDDACWRSAVSRRKNFLLKTLNIIESSFGAR